MIIANKLIDRGLVSEAALAEARTLQRAEGLRLDRALIQLGIVSEQQILQVFAEEWHLPFADLTDVEQFVVSTQWNNTPAINDPRWHRS